MTRFIEVPSGDVVDIDSLLDLYKDKGKWKSDTTAGATWTWEDKSVPVIRKAMIARKGGSLRGSFVCDHCGAPNIVEDE